MISDKGIPSIWEELNKINDSLRKLCPHQVGDLYVTLNQSNPATLWVGTTWEKVEGAFIRATSGSESPSITKAGSDSVTIGINNLPAHSHSASGSALTAGHHTHSANHNHTASQASHLHTQPSHSHPIQTWNGTGQGGSRVSSYAQAFATSVNHGDCHNSGGENTGTAQPAVTVDTANVTTSSGGDHTHNLSVSVSNTGGNIPINVVPTHIKANVWRRLT